MNYVLYGLMPEAPAETEKALWDIAVGCAEEFGIPINRSRGKDLIPLKSFLDSQIQAETREIVLVVFTLLREPVSATAEAFQEISKETRRYSRFSIHPTFLVFSDINQNAANPKDLVSDGHKVFFFSGSFIDGSKVGKNALPLFEYFLKTLFSMGDTEIIPLLRGQGLCAFGCKVLEFPLKEIARQSLLDSFDRFRSGQLEGDSPPFELSLDMDFTIPSMPEMPVISNPFKSRDIDDLLFITEDGFDGDKYINHKAQSVVAEFKRAKLDSFKVSCRNLWHDKLKRNLNSLNIDRIGNHLRESGNLNALKARLLLETEKLTQAGECVHKEETNAVFTRIVSQFVEKIRNLFSLFSDKLWDYRRARAFATYFRWILFTFILLFASSLAFFITKVPLLSFRTKLSASLGFSIAGALVISLLVRAYKIHKARERAELQLEELMNGYTTGAKRAWDAWVLPQKKNIEGKMKLRAVDYFRFFISSILKEIDIYQDYLRRSIDFFQSPRSYSRIKSAIEIPTDISKALKSRLLESFQPSWNQDFFSEFEDKLERKELILALDAYLQRYQRTYLEKARQEARFEWGRLDREKFQEAVESQGQRNMPIKVRPDYSPDNALRVVFSPKEIEDDVRRSSSGAASVVPWGFREALCGTIFWSDIDISELLNE